MFDSGSQKSYITGIQCLVVADFAICKKLTKVIHMSIEPEKILN